MWIIVDNISASFIKDATLDYKDEMIRSGFEIFNPNADTSCGCKYSFSIKD